MTYRHKDHKGEDSRALASHMGIGIAISLFLIGFVLLFVCEMRWLKIVGAAAIGDLNLVF